MRLWEVLIEWLRIRKHITEMRGKFGMSYPDESVYRRLPDV